MILTFTSCDEESNFNDTGATLVPVYSITDISGSGAPFAINIYKEQNLIIEYTSAVNVVKFSASSFADNSTETDFEFNVAKIVDLYDEEGNKTGEEIIGYWISATKDTDDEGNIFGTGTLSVVTTDETGATNTKVLNITVVEKEVFN